MLANHAISATPAGVGSPDLSYVVTRGIAAGAYALAGRTGPTVAIADIGELLFHYEKDLTVALQERRPDLLFLHAAALEFRGKAYLLAGESGSGKSTTAWGLLHHGFQYLSDELGPIDLNSMQVLAYPRALCLKRLPPLRYPLPSGALALGGAYHLPVQAAPSAGAHQPRDLAAIFFVRHRQGLHAPALSGISAAEGAARLYVTALNALAHPHCGLDAVARVAERVPCYALESADLRATCELVSRTISGEGRQRPDALRQESNDASRMVRTRNP
jgi:hypothetical protein